jgi:hypothetical protein
VTFFRHLRNSPHPSSQIFSGDSPFADIRIGWAIAAKVIRGERPFRPSDCKPWGYNCKSLGLDDEMWALVEDCWNTNPDLRPTAREIVQRLRPLVKSHPVSNPMQPQGYNHTILHLFLKDTTQKWSFRRFSSTSEAPEEWLHANRAHLWHIMDSNRDIHGLIEYLSGDLIFAVSALVSCILVNI